MGRNRKKWEETGKTVKKLLISTKKGQKYHTVPRRTKKYQEVLKSNKKENKPKNQLKYRIEETKQKKLIKF